MNLTPKAALKTPALQTRPRVPDALLRREAFGVRASLAPLFRRRSPKVRFRGLRREPLREILSPRRRSGERIKERIPRSPDSRLEPLNRKGKNPKDLGRTKMFFPLFPHLCPSQIFGWIHGKEVRRLGRPLSPALSPLVPRGKRIPRSPIRALNP